jgi:hypothetical protein
MDEDAQTYPALMELMKHPGLSTGNAIPMRKPGKKWRWPRIKVRFGIQSG